jgi:uncharacterized protein YndB with AHSA1/START domain
MNHDDRSDEAADSIVIECELPERPEMVWRALTVPELVAEWLMPNDLRPEIGRRFTLQGKPEEGGAIGCEVLDVEPERLLRYSWRGIESDADGSRLDTVVTFVLTETPAGGTHLRIVHSGFSQSQRQRNAFCAVAGRAVSSMRARSAERPRRDRRALIGRAVPTAHSVPTRSRLRRAA